MREAGRRNWRSEIRARLEPLRLAPERETEIVEEVAQHLDDRFGELMAMGRSESDAAAEAWRELEAADVLGREVSRVEQPRPMDLPPPGAPARGGFLASLAADVRFSVRSLRKNPSYSIPVLLALALAIGPTTAIVSVSNWLLWRPLPGVQRPNELGLAWFGRWFKEGGVAPAGLSYANIHDLRTGARTVAGFAGAQERSDTLSIGDREPDVVRTATVTSNFFHVLGLPIRHGRDFQLEDDRLPIGAPVVIISEGLANSAFGGPAGAIGQRLTLNRKTFEVIGVAPPEFAGINRVGGVQIWMTGATMPYLLSIPDVARYTVRGGGSLYLFVVRIADGYRWSDVELELTNLAAGLAAAHPNDNQKFAASGTREAVTPRLFAGLGEEPLGRERTQKTITLLLAVGSVLVLLGCANVTNLMLFRAGRREREVAVRKALGASQARLIQLQLTESWLLSIGGAACGLVLAIVLKTVLQDLLFPLPPGFSATVPMDWRVLTVTLGVATLTGLLAGLAPAWLSARSRLSSALGRGGTRSASRAPRLRSGLAVVQLALSLTLLIGALLLVTTVRNLHAVDLGFDADQITTHNINLPSLEYNTGAAIQFWRGLQSATEASGEFESVATAVAAPFGGSFRISVLPPGTGTSEPLLVAGNGISHTYFRTLSMSLARGRDFTADEAFAARSAALAPVIINETMARRLFGSTDVVGRPVRVAKTVSHPEQDLPIVGVVRDTRESLTGEISPILYMPLGPFDFATRCTIIVRSRRPTPQTAASIRAIVARLDKNLPVTGGLPIFSMIDRGMQQQRLFAWTLSVLGALGFVLAALGVYGLVAQAAAERSREFGIRIAIGADRAHIARLVLRFAATIAAMGTAGGVALAYFGSRAVASMLFGITALDPRVYLVAIGALALVVLAACTVPVLRAMRIQPVDVLKAD
ncbi:MAG: ADOP family duplicated permease [Vicinamibacterales bacterium]